MPLMYPVKHVFRNWKLFTALLIGITLAATFCAAIGVKANLSAEQALDTQLSYVNNDIQFNADLNQSNLKLAIDNITSISGVKSVTHVAHFNLPISLLRENYSIPIYTDLVSFPNSSDIYSQWEDRPLSGIPENYTYLVEGTTLAKQTKIGDNITAVLTFPQPKYWNNSLVYVNLTVAGYATLTNEGYSLIRPSTGPIYTGSSGGSVTYINGVQVFTSTPSSGYRGDLMIISWENTLEKLWNSTLDSSTASFSFNVNVDRQKLINPWNLDVSVDKINKISDKIQNEILANYLAKGTVTNQLSNTLSNLRMDFGYTIYNLLIISVPIFFVAWYLGSTVSDVSFNIRRREIGLLSTKGLSSGQIQRMFLTEAIVIGLVGGFLGVVGGLIVNQYYAGTVNLDNLFSSNMFTPEIVVITVIFSVILALLSVFWSSRKASRIPAVEALREYLPMDTKSRWRFVPWIAFILGSYKIAIYIFSINLQEVLYSEGNFFIYAVRGPLLLFDTIMTVFGPILFFWGLTKIIIRDSTKFQVVASKISSVMGDLGALAAKNVRRNPARLAAIAFLIAFIIGYSVQVNGQIASQQDYIYRQAREGVGADLVVNVVNSTRGQLVLDDILANVTGIQNATIVRTYSATLSDTYGNIQIKAIYPESWKASAYYESSWFSGTSVDQMLKDLRGSNNTIILDRAIAKQYGYQLYDEAGIDFRSCPRKLRIIGFFGPEPPSTQGSTISYPGSPNIRQSFYSRYYSYVPADLFNITFGSDIFKLEYINTEILIKEVPGANGTAIADQIRDQYPNQIYGVVSFDEQWQRTSELQNLSTFGSQQTLDIQGLGLVFAVLSASVGTALIAVVSLKERSREATLMSVRGLSYRQLVWMFLVESMAIITFAVVLGIVVGVIIVYGTVNASNITTSSYQLVTQRLIYPPNAIATIGTYVALIYAATIGAILVMTSQYVTKLEKMVRAR